jgi:short-subunit dehydrogenase
LLAVTQAFLPLLRQARGRLINVSSTATLIVIPFHGPYSASKLCVNGFSDALRLELKPFGIQVSALVVGSMDTPIWDKAAQRSEKIGRAQPPEADKLYGKQFGRFRDYMQDMGRNGASPQTVARVVAGALTARRARPYYLVGQDAQRIGFLKRIIPERFRDGIVLKTIGIEG